MYGRFCFQIVEGRHELLDSPHWTFSLDIQNEVAEKAFIQHKCLFQLSRENEARNDFFKSCIHFPYAKISIPERKQAFSGSQAHCSIYLILSDCCFSYWGVGVGGVGQALRDVILTPS